MTARLPGRALVLVALASLVAAACGGVATTAPAATPVPTAPMPAPTATATAVPSGAWVVGDKSKATVRVREQLAGVNFPSDAVLVATGAAGSFELRDDGTFTPGSKISFDLTTLASDQRDRDNFVKQGTLAVRQFPKVELVPTKASGLALPLAVSGDFTFRLTGKMTIHGTGKEVTFDVQAKRDGSDLNATATANPTWRFEDFGMSPPSSFRVLSVVDEIRLVVEIVAAGPKA